MAPHMESHTTALAQLDIINMAYNCVKVLLFE